MSKTANTIISGTGMALPKKVLTNSDLEKIVETSDEWIVSRTGIRERRKLEEGFSNVDLSESAGREALERAAVKPSELDLIIVATVTPDHPTPSTSCLLQSRLNAQRAAAFDLSAGCSGFVYALSVAHQFISTGAYKNALIVGVEVLSRVTDWEDRSTCVLFGDGAGAVVLTAGEGERGIIDFSLHSDGRGAELLMIPAGGSAMPASTETLENRMHFIKMNGNEIFKFAVKVVEDNLSLLLKRNGYEASDLDHLFLHQANLRIIEHIRKKLKLSPEKVPMNIDRLGNTSSATIPIAMHEELTEGRLKNNELIAMVAFGAGLTWGGMLMKW
ncbi:MAG: beta-ketoacyl-ACP synthase III [Bacillota bacterium]